MGEGFQPWKILPTSALPSVQERGAEKATLRTTVIGCFHPAAGLHSPDRLQFTAQDMQAAKRIMGGEQGLWVPRLVDPDYRLLESNCIGPSDEVGVDTEGTAAHPHCLTFSVKEDTGWMILADDITGIAAFKMWLALYTPLVILHNAPHDLAVLRAMGVDLLQMGLRIYDTMSAAHVLQTEPRGLKPLSRRLLGIDMPSFTEVTGPTWERIMREWLENAKEHPWPHPGKRKKLIPKRIDTLLDKTGSAFRKAWRSWELKNRMLGTVGHPPEVDYNEVPGFTFYAIRDADTTRQSKQILQARIEEEGLEDVLDLDLSVLPFVDQIKSVGLYCDLEKLVTYHAEIQKRKAAATQVVRALVDDEGFNPGSADQVERQLRPYLTRLAAQGRCRLTKAKRRYQADDGVLKQILDDDPLVPAVLEYRELDKLDTSYLLPLYAMLQWDPETELFRLPLDLTHAHVVSGRMSGRVLTWPKQTEDGRRLRGCFVAPPGWKMGSWDLSQIEMRVAAALSQDPTMIQAFKDDQDLHALSASQIFGKTYEECLVYPGKMSYRHPTKTVSYLVLYGGGGEKLFIELKIMKVDGFDRSRSEQLIVDWLGLYSTLDAYIHSQAEKNRARGYATTFTGRRRYLPGMGLIGRRWPYSKLREESERQGFNFEMQGGAQDLMKEAEVQVMQVKEDLREMGVGFEPCLQLHDEVLALVKEEHWDVVDPLMRVAMHDGRDFHGVPLKCGGQMGENWGELK